ncbi:MAG: hypothetical protein KGH62_01815, partial [Candidatus Micrarchaeota archaeon]|nr:hypothetical protein [Candidatus Micrarchaeota archaeon]
AENSLNIMQKITENGSITLNELIKIMLKSGAKSQDVLRELRKIGFDDNVLSDGFAYACHELDSYGNQ